VPTNTPEMADLAEAERRQRILVEVSRIFLDYTGIDEVEPLRRVVEKIVEGFGDWCAISLVPGPAPAGARAPRA